jgi:Fe-S-cluster containining protein
MFVNIKDVNTVYYDSCEGCQYNCCSYPRVLIAPLILDDFIEAYKNFAIMFCYIDYELKAQMVINQGESCKYLVDYKCTIYEERPPVCRMFPISPYFDEFFINTTCTALTTDESNSGVWICKDGKFNDVFYHKRVENFVEKLNKTKEFLRSIEYDLKKVKTIKGIDFYVYDGKNLDNEYIKLHLESQKHL